MTGPGFEELKDRVLRASEQARQTRESSWSRGTQSMHFPVVATRLFTAT